MPNLVYSFHVTPSDHLFFVAPSRDTPPLPFSTKSYSVSLPTLSTFLSILSSTLTPFQSLIARDALGVRLPVKETSTRALLRLSLPHLKSHPFFLSTIHPCASTILFFLYYFLFFIASM